MVFERRMCSLGKIPIPSCDKGSVQIVLAVLDQYGQVTGESTIYDISGSVRRSGAGDDLLLEKIRSEEYGA